MRNLEQADRFHLEAAEGWLDLGDFVSANQELDETAPELHFHPAVLALRYEVYSKAEQWDGAAEIAGALVRTLPGQAASWICLAYSTRRKTGGGVQQARDILMETKSKFPKDYRIPFNLACYECELGHFQTAKERLKEAFDLAGKKDIRQQALGDPDLEPLWSHIGEI
jgi:predicted Zn-dependent protease